MYVEGNFLVNMCPEEKKNLCLKEWRLPPQTLFNLFFLNQFKLIEASFRT